MLQTCELPTTSTNTSHCQDFSLMVGISIDGLQLFFWWEILYCCEVLRNFCGEIKAFFKIIFKILKNLEDLVHTYGSSMQSKNYKDV